MSDTEEEDKPNLFNALLGDSDEESSDSSVDEMVKTNLNDVDECIEKLALDETVVDGDEIDLEENEDVLEDVDEDEKVWMNYVDENCIYEFKDLVGKVLIGSNPISETLVKAAFETITNKSPQSKPTDIQKQCWNILANKFTRKRNLIGIARTGSGKTLAFLLPAISLVLETVSTHTEVVCPSVLIIAPTRELSEQIFQVAKTISNFNSETKFNVCCAVGGTSYQEQINIIQDQAPRMVIGTLGRVISLCGKIPHSNQMRMQHTTSPENEITDKCLSCEKIQLVVLDEGDRLLDMGFSDDLLQLYNLLNSPVQVILTSATWTEEEFSSNPVTKLFLGDMLDIEGPILVSTEDAGKVASRTVQQSVEMIKDKGAYRFRRLLVKLSEIFKHFENARVFVFTMHKQETKDIAKQISSSFTHRALCLNGDMSQKARFEAVESFRSGETRILVATDVASRGIDIRGVTHVINYSFGMSAESYIHRIGRCGRSGTYGYAHTFFIKGDEKFAPALFEILNEARQQIPNDLRILAMKQSKKGEKQVKVLTEEDQEKLEQQQANRERQLRQNAAKKSKGKNVKQKRRR